MARKRTVRHGVTQEVREEAGHTERPTETFIVYDRTPDSDDDDSCDDHDPVEKLGRFVSRFARAEQAFAQRYLQLHRESNRERAGGWFFDFEENMYHALRTGGRKLKLWKVVGL
jgi:hypothetical protein